GPSSPRPSCTRAGPPTPPDAAQGAMHRLPSYWPCASTCASKGRRHVDAGAPAGFDTGEIGISARDFESEASARHIGRDLDGAANAEPDRAGVEDRLLDAGDIFQPAATDRAKDIRRRDRVAAADAKRERTRQFAAQRHPLIGAERAGGKGGQAVAAIERDLLGTQHRLGLRELSRRDHIETQIRAQRLPRAGTGRELSEIGPGAL